MSKRFKSATSPDRALPKAESDRRELAHRSSDGVDVTLYWHPALDELLVAVCDERHGTSFEISPQRDLALDVYYHPYAYSNSAHVYERENRLAA
jgi:hypothetical protein